MRLVPVPGEKPEQYAERQTFAVRAARNYIPLVGYESGLGVVVRTAPAWPAFRTQQHPQVDSPLLGTDSVEQLARLDYFGWQIIKDLGNWDAQSQQRQQLRRCHLRVPQAPGRSACQPHSPHAFLTRFRLSRPAPGGHADG